MTDTAFQPPTELDPLLSPEGELVTPAGEHPEDPDPGATDSASPDDEPPTDPEQPGDPGSAGDDEQQPPAAQLLGRTPEQLAELSSKLDQGATRWRKRVGELFGPEDFAVLVPCELCTEVPGFHFPAELLQPESELEARLIAVLRGGVEGPQLQTDPEIRACAVCGGEGKTLTGSKVRGRETTKCRACKGYGYVPPPGDANAPADLDDAPVEAVEPGEPLATAEDTDAWGSPHYLADGQENPNWGRMPQYKDPAYP